MTNRELLITVHRYIKHVGQEQAFRLLLPWLDAVPSRSELERRVRSLQSRYSRVQEKGAMGLLAPDEVETETNRVTYALLAIVEAIEKGKSGGPLDGPTEEEPEPAPPSGRRFRVWRVAVAGVVLLLSGLIYYDETQPENFDLSVVFYGDSAKGKILKTGEARFLYGGESDTKQPDEEGVIKLRNLEPEWRGTSLKINPMFPGYSLEQLETLIPWDGTTIEVVLNQSDRKK